MNGIMLPLPDVDAYMEQWEHLKNCSVPTPCSLDEAIRFTHLKNVISDISHLIRKCRLENDTEAEMWYEDIFIENYEEFEKDFVFRTLKNK